MRKILRKFKWQSLIAAGLMLSVPGMASALVTTHHASDITLQNESFVAEGRIGDRSGTTTFELDIGATTSAPAQTANYNWANGYAHPFSLTYNNITNIVSFTVGDVTLTYSPTQVSTDIYIRTRAVNADTSIVLNNLVLDGVPVNDTSSAANPGSGIEILQISGGTLSDGFTLTGKSKMTWTGSPPTQSMLAYQITIADGRADMDINMTGFPDPVIVGQNLTYTINATNNGPSTANNIIITDTLPLSVNLFSVTSTHGSCIGTIVVTCDISSLDKDETATVTIVVTPTTAELITNVVTVSADETDPDTGNDTASIDTMVNASADLSITKSDSPPDTVIVGNSLLYTINVTNNGLSSATNVIVTDALHANVTYGSATPSQGICSGTTTVSCNLGTLANGASASVMVVVTPTVVGTIDNTAAVAADEDDPDLSNNTSLTEYTLVIAAPSGSADLSITKEDLPDPVPQVGDNVTYTIKVKNNGLDPATGVSVTDTLNSLTYVSVTTTHGTCTGGTTVNCTIGALAYGEEATITIVAGTNPPAGMISNTASVTGNETDPNMANNSATANTNVGDVSRLINLSSRAVVQTGFNVVTGGFVVGGSTPKTLLIRGRGPSLSGAPYNFSGTLSNPMLQIWSITDGKYVAQNDNWQTTDPLCAESGYTCGTPSNITATGKDPCQPNPGQTVAPPGCSNEAALLITVPPGRYTVTESGVNDGTGLGIFEIFDPDTSTLPKLNNLSTRAVVQTDANALTGGFIIGAGTGNKTVLIRGRGPSMSGAPYNYTETLSNPMLQLWSITAGKYIAQNDDWQTTDPLCAENLYVCGTPADITATGKDPCQPNPGQTVAPPGCSNESVLMITLPPGRYTVTQSGVNNDTGLGIFEVFDLTP